MRSTTLNYVASVLDPRIKTLWIQEKHSETNSIQAIQKIRRFISQNYPSEPYTSQLKTPEKVITSDVDHYFDSPVLDWDGNEDSD